MHGFELCPQMCRERSEASDFNAALFEHAQYLRRKKAAAEMREAYTANAEGGNGVASTSQTDMSLKPGETITLKLAKVRYTSLQLNRRASMRWMQLALCYPVTQI